jgi:hypothetical protein
MRLCIATCVVGALLLATGCGSGESSAVENAAQRFEAAVAARDAATACLMLGSAARSQIESSAGKPCVDAWAGERVPVGGHVARVRAYGSMAIVELDADTIFLAKYADGWRITAADCAPKANKPFDCQIKES